MSQYCYINIIHAVYNVTTVSQSRIFNISTSLIPLRNSCNKVTLVTFLIISIFFINLLLKYYTLIYIDYEKIFISRYCSFGLMRF